MRVLGRDDDFWFEKSGRAAQGRRCLSLALKVGYDLDRQEEGGYVVWPVGMI